MSDVLIKLNGLPTPLACDLPHAREFVLNGWPNSVHGFWSAEVESVWGSPPRLRAAHEQAQQAPRR
jgi:hypothetical protein